MSRLFPSGYKTGTRHRAQRGASLIMVMMILIIVSILGVAGVQISLMGERGARNDRDIQVATQAAEAALMDAELELFANTVTNSRKDVFSPLDQSKFLPGCGTSGKSRGLCTLASTGKAAWLTVDFKDATGSAPTSKFGEWTGRSFAAGDSGVQPYQAPRYIVELVPDRSGSATDPARFAYRVTAMGFGPRQETQVVMQMIYRN